MDILFTYLRNEISKREIKNVIKINDIQSKIHGLFQLQFLGIIFPP